jgi:hypothetical protein
MKLKRLPAKDKLYHLYEMGDWNFVMVMD